MISKKLETALNEQINRELYSAYLYLGIAAHFESEGLKGFAGWMKKQAGEEQEHAMKIYNYLFAVDGKPILTAIQAVETQYAKTPEEIMQHILKHEESVTASINSLYELAFAEHDYKTQSGSLPSKWKKKIPYGIYLRNLNMQKATRAYSF